jgi:hypothetical protein
MAFLPQRAASSEQLWKIVIFRLYQTFYPEKSFSSVAQASSLCQEAS